jgi:hypothetical protein
MLVHEQLESWTEDPNEYVADEDDEIRFNARASCTHLLNEIAKNFGKVLSLGLSFLPREQLGLACLHGLVLTTLVYCDHRRPPKLLLWASASGCRSPSSSSRAAVLLGGS